MKPVQHLEFFDIDHFENNYHRMPAAPALRHFIDFFWETRFDNLWKEHPGGFSDAQFPNIGYTYIINLGSPFVMQVNNQKFPMRTDGFLPRYNAIECFHREGNHLFGIKFRVSPVIFEKKVDFSEYQGYIFPLSYLLNQAIIDDVKKAGSFEKRIAILTRYFLSLLKSYHGSMHPVKIISEILEHCFQNNEFTVSFETLSKKYKISSRTLQRYFEMCTGISGKKALQVMRIRKATAHLANSPATFHYSLYGYYDHSHFYKHLKQFLHENTLKVIAPHLKLLQGLHK